MHQTAAKCRTKLTYDWLDMTWRYFDQLVHNMAIP